MALFYKGVGVGTHLHTRDLRITGLAPHNPGGSSTVHAVVQHIARGTVTSPCISLTKSYGVALAYARNASRSRPTSARPAHVYEIEIVDPLPPGMLVIDPVNQIASSVSNPLASPSYHHDGSQSFLAGVVDPKAMAHYLQTPISFPPGRGGIPRPANLSIELEAMVYAMRDAEILIIGNLPRGCVINRFDIF